MLRFHEKLQKLAPKRLRFCEEYIFDLNDTEAAQRAGYSKKSAQTTAHDLLTIPDIQAEIDELIKEWSLFYPSDFLVA